MSIVMSSLKDIQLSTEISSVFRHVKFERCEKCSPSPSRLEVLLSDVFVNYFVDQRDCFCLCVTIVCVMIRPSHRCSFVLDECRIL